MLICDEITSSLDKKNKIEIINEIKKLKENLTIIFITHDEQLKDYADNIINLNNENGIQNKTLLIMTLSL